MVSGAAKGGCTHLQASGCGIPPRQIQSQQLTAALQDLEQLRLVATRNLQPAHRCKAAGTDECIVEPWIGNELADALKTWLKNGFVLDDDDVENKEMDPAREAANLRRFGERNQIWLDEQCKATNQELREKFYLLREQTNTNWEMRQEALKELERMMKGFQKAALSRMIESGVFWTHPGKGTALVEAQSQQAMQQCRVALEQTRQHMENYLIERELRGKDPERGKPKQDAEVLASAPKSLRLVPLPTSPLTLSPYPSSPHLTPPSHLSTQERACSVRCLSFLRLHMSHITRCLLPAAP